MTELPFWERPEIVERFGSRAPDHRLSALLADRESEGLPALDVGCAAGRNTVLLAERGADVWAVDASAAMVEATRARLAAILGPDEADRRVLHGRMDDLGRFGDGSFQLVVALGAFQNAASAAELEDALAEARRVLAPDGTCLVANFAPDSRPRGEPLQPVPGEPHIYNGFGGPHRRVALLSVDELDRAFARHGLRPVVPTEAVRVPTERGHRTTVNALYRKAAVEGR